MTQEEFDKQMHEWYEAKAQEQAEHIELVNANIEMIAIFQKQKCEYLIQIEKLKMDKIKLNSSIAQFRDQRCEACDKLVYERDKIIYEIHSLESDIVYEKAKIVQSETNIFHARMEIRRISRKYHTLMHEFIKAHPQQECAAESQRLRAYQRDLDLINNI